MRNKDFVCEAAKHNITEIGFLSAKPYNHLFDKEYKSIVVALFPYFCGVPDDSNLSLYTRGTDYHIVIKKIFDNIFGNLSIKDYTVYADTGPEIDRELAYCAGLGFKGMNGLIINEKYGSYTFVGYALCNEEFKYSSSAEKSCIGCRRCVEMCPGKALSNDGKFIIDKCLSYITQKKGELSSGDIKIITDSGTIFGCDVCQRVCPHNTKVSYTDIEDFYYNLIDNLYLDDVINLTNKEFKNKFGNRAFSWRGKGLLERNLRYFGTLYEHNKTER